MKKVYSTKDLCLIIEACARGSVAEFESEGIRLKFHASGRVEDFLPPPLVRASETTASFEDVSEPNHDVQAKQSVEQDELREKEERLAMLLLEDPAEFERLLGSDDLEDIIQDGSTDGDDISESE